MADDLTPGHFIGERVAAELVDTVFTPVIHEQGRLDFADQHCSTGTHPQTGSKARQRSLTGRAVEAESRDVLHCFFRRISMAESVLNVLPNLKILIACCQKNCCLSLKHIAGYVDSSV